mmetsp:Transcript_26212/g.71226  ORF Transcript_26212/g.71226 Transcript_26212/m.71226 type:complete len:646 (-) Transcript_26212:251-2188(-)
MAEQDGCYRIAFAVHGTRGDFQPYLCFGMSLVKRGHKVRYYTSCNHCETAALFGGESVVTAGDIEEGLTNDTAKHAMEKGDMALMVLGSKKEEEEKVNGMTIGELREKAKEDIESFRPHVYLTNVLGHCSEFDELLSKKETFEVCIGLQPQGGPPSNAFKNIGWARGFPEPDIPLICTHIWNRQDEARRSHQMAQSLYFTGQMTEELYDRIPGPETIFRNTFEIEKKYDFQILAYSRNVFPPPDDWPDVLSADSRTRIIGRLQFTREQQDELSKGGNQFFSTTEAHEVCKAFLAKGSPPVYIGWGSMSVYTSEHMTFLAVEALKRADQRGIILSGWAKLSADDLKADRPNAEEVRAWAEQNVLFMKNAPHEWLFPQCSCCVHHGGIGTTQGSLGAGTPTIITPVFADQECNAKSVQDGGWGIGTTKLGKLKSKELGEAIRKVCTDSSFKERAAELHAKMGLEDGLTAGAEYLERRVKEELLTGKYKERKESEKAELRQIREKQMKLPTETILAKWNGELNKRYPAWAEYNKRNMRFGVECRSIVEEGRLWCVTASSCLVREGEKLQSEEVGRFKKFCFLEQVEKKGSRLRVKKLRGFGPEQGWVSPTTSGKDILEHITDPSRIGAIQNEMYSNLFADILEAVGAM